MERLVFFIRFPLHQAVVQRCLAERSRTVSPSTFFQLHFIGLDIPIRSRAIRAVRGSLLRKRSISGSRRSPAWGSRSVTLPVKLS